MNRRDLLKVSAGAGVVGARSESLEAKTLSTSQLHPIGLGPRMNFAHADKIMSQLDIDALVLGEGMNFEYATGVRAVSSLMGWPAPALVIVKRGDRDRLTIVTTGFAYYYLLADALNTSSIPAFLYTAPQPGADPASDSAIPLAKFRNRGEIALDAIESSRVAKAEKAISEQGIYPTVGKALARALTEIGLTKSRVATDHPFVASTLAKAVPKVSGLDASDALRRIRPVKSDIEIALMRQAASGNVRAARAALETVAEGGTYRDLRGAFYAEAALLGHRGVFMAVDRVTDEMFSARFAEGQAFMIDCVSEYQGYHGDYGRTVFVGEPAKVMKQATKAMSSGWDKLREKLKPGLRFSEISSMGRDLLSVAGKSYQIFFGPHSVGLFHSDHLDPSGVNQPEDIILEPGMVISVDCPLLESGVGGSAHLEDLMLITADGAEPLHDIGDPVIVI